jgi:hypothetical protein
MPDMLATDQSLIKAPAPSSGDGRSDEPHNGICAVENYAGNLKSHLGRPQKD